MKRRSFLDLSIKSAMAAGYTSMIPASLLYSNNAEAKSLLRGILSNPARQPLFENLAPNALAKSFKYKIKDDQIEIYAAQSIQYTGLVGGEDGMTPVPTTIWGYGANGNPVTWPGMTLERRVGDDPLKVKWRNGLVDSEGQALPHLLPYDKSLHWAYSLTGYEDYSIEQHGVPLVPHVHGGANDPEFDGNPEFFFSPGSKVKGPRFVTDNYVYGDKKWNDQAGMLWYHDHSLGLTRMNVYAGLAGFFSLRDENDSGKRKNEAGLPADPYELGFAVQDRMFRKNGELFYPAFPGDPFYDDFIDDTIQGTDEWNEAFPNDGPTALAEFFGDHMLVNGVIWPKYDVEQRQYRVRLLNGTDSRFMRLKLKVVGAGRKNPSKGKTLPFYIVGSDQGLRRRAARVDEVDFMPGERLDLVIDFKEVKYGQRVIIENLLGDAPFGGDLPEPYDENGESDDLFPNRRTDRVMAFDVMRNTDKSIRDTDIHDHCDMVRHDTTIAAGYELNGDIAVPGPVARTRKLALFEGTDEFGRLQPLLGTAQRAKDKDGNLINWPEEEGYSEAGLTGPMKGSIPWHAPITENPELNTTEIWEFYNATGDAHPVHVHLVHFKVLNRQGFTHGVKNQKTLQHNGELGDGFKLTKIRLDKDLDGNDIIRKPDASERTRRDMVMALPGEVTRIKLHFDKPGRYVWHCHILSHEDHEMMRPFHVGKVPLNDHDHDHDHDHDD